MRPIVVFLHIHYDDTWPALCARLKETIRLPFRVVVTGAAASRIAPPQSNHLIEWTVLGTANRGRDVLPFLQALRQTGNFDVGLKLHGKRSVHRLDGDAWGSMLHDALLPSSDQVAALIARFEDDPRIGLVGASSSFCSIALHIGRNHSALERVAGRLGHSSIGLRKHTPFFCAGTMFWFRRDAFSALSTDDLTDLFEPEAGQTDGTAAHAFERLFQALCEDAGFLTTSVDVALTCDAAKTAAALREATLQYVDADETFVRVPGALAAVVLKRLPRLARAYEALPTPVRRLVRWSATRGRGFGRR